MFDYQCSRKGCAPTFLTFTSDKVYANILFQQPLALVSRIIHRDSLGGAASCVRRLAVCYVVMCYICFFCSNFRLYKVIISWIMYIIASLYFFLSFGLKCS
jgi:Ca2+/Na+ antiporter